MVLGTSQGDDGNFASRVKAYWQVRDTQSAARVADHAALAPQTARRVLASLEVGDDGPPARQADLTAMCMATEIK